MRRKLVQSLLSFPEKATLGVRSDVFPSTSDRPVDAHCATKPPPNLPMELWQMILLPLGNFSIKKFRLVHPNWAFIGAPYLFRTVYLTVHSHSVDGLIQIAGSTCATFVNKIVCSPFALWPDCLEADTWRATYKNLLANVKHAELVELPQVYRRLFRDQTRNQPNDQITTLASVIEKLTNCCEFAIDDGVEDIESACCDVGLRSAVQRSSMFHRASIWVSKPRQGLYSYSFAAQSCIQIIGALLNSPTITAVTVACGEWLWTKIVEALIDSRHRRCQPQRPVYLSAFGGVHSLCLTLKRTTNCDRQACSSNPRVLLEYLDLFEFPQLVHLAIKIVPVRNGIFDEMSIDDPRDPESDRETESESLHDELISDSESTQTSSDRRMPGTAWRREDAPDFADVFDPIQHYRTFVEETQLQFGVVRFPKLERLTVGNILIDTDLLLAWCWVQPRLPQSRLTITMIDVVIFDELALEDFVSALASLNVELIYDYRSTGYYERSQWAYKVNSKNQCMVVDSKRFHDTEGWIDYVGERVLALMPPMVELPTPKAKMLLHSRRAEDLRRYSRLSNRCEWTGSEIDEEYLLNFWDDIQDPVACPDGTPTEEVEVMDIDERGLYTTQEPGRDS